MSPGEASLRPMEPLAHSLAKFGQTPPKAAPYPRIRSGFLLFQHLPALVHAGLQIEVVRTAQFAGILVLGIGRLLQRVRRTAHATPRGRCFSTGNGHVGILWGIVGGIVRGRTPGAMKRELKCR